MGYCCWLESGLQVPFYNVLTFDSNKNIHKYIVFLWANKEKILRIIILYWKGTYEKDNNIILERHIRNMTKIIIYIMENYLRNIVMINWILVKTFLEGERSRIYWLECRRCETKKLESILWSLYKKKSRIWKICCCSKEKS